MKTLAIIGSNGMLGLDLLHYLSEKFDITPINKENYSAHIGSTFDIVINANGNSKRYWANQHPSEDFEASTVSVIKSIFNFPTDLYIYISSPDVYQDYTSSEHTKENEKIKPENLSSYGLHKYLAELIVKKHTKKFLILRSAMMLGTKLKKGPFFDIANNNPLYISLKSKLQLITTSAIAEIITILLEKSISDETINLGGKNIFDFGTIKEYIDKEIQTSDSAQTQTYEMNVEKLNSLYPNLKTSEEYLKKYLRNL